MQLIPHMTSDAKTAHTGRDSASSKRMRLTSFSASASLRRKSGSFGAICKCGQPRWLESSLRITEPSHAKAAHLCCLPEVPCR